MYCTSWLVWSGHFKLWKLHVSITITHTQYCIDQATNLSTSVWFTVAPNKSSGPRQILESKTCMVTITMYSISQSPLSTQNSKTAGQWHCRYLIINTGRTPTGAPLHLGSNGGSSRNAAPKQYFRYPAKVPGLARIHTGAAISAPKSACVWHKCARALCGGTRGTKHMAPSPPPKPPCSLIQSSASHTQAWSKLSSALLQSSTGGPALWHV